MTDDDVLHFQPAVAEVTNRQLDVLADRVEALMQAEHAELVVAPAGRDEVSQTVARTLTEVHTGFAESTLRGVTEIREIAATVRANGNDLASADQEFIA